MFKPEGDDEFSSAVLQDLLEKGVEGSTPPPLPPGGIPKQFLPKVIRQLLKWVVLPFVLIDDAMQRVAKKVIRPPFKREGQCLKRGNCCRYVLIHRSKTVIGFLFYFWYTQVNGFYLRDKKLYDYEGKKMYVMGCRYLKKDGTCGQYRLRPLICRQWPVIERFGYPKILKGCGFRSSPPYPPEPKKDQLSSPPSLKVLQ